MSLYSEYRPTSFSEMVGNFATLENHLNNPKHNHVLLFTGPSGVGKTCSSRILASMAGATEMDIQEINCADRGGIDDIRSLLDDMSLSSFGKAKVYILDECHKITTAAQNCLLKALEDTPPHVYFILCSSEPKTIIKAIQTRALLVHFPPLIPDAIYGILRSIKIKEKFNVSKDILFSIADICEGSARKAINLLETVSALPPESQLDTLQTSGSSDTPEIIDFCRLFFNEKPTWKELRACLKGLKEAGIEPEVIRRSLLGYGQALLLGENNNDEVALRMEKLMYMSYDSGFPGLVVQIYKAWAADIRGF
jgi:DNA polymerase-3 subunit gamma/tau